MLPNRVTSRGALMRRACRDSGSTLSRHLFNSRFSGMAQACPTGEPPLPFRRQTGYTTGNDAAVIPGDTYFPQLRRAAVRPEKHHEHSGYIRPNRAPGRPEHALCHRRGGGQSRGQHGHRPPSGGRSRRSRRGRHQVSDLQGRHAGLQRFPRLLGHQQGTHAQSVRTVPKA